MTDPDKNWQVRKAQADESLHERLAAAIADGRVDVFTDQRMLDFQGSPIHNSWDHLVPLLVLMSLAMLVLLTAGVAFGIVAMTIGVLVHLLSIKHLVAWRIRARALDYLSQGAPHLNHLWHLGGVALVMKNSNEPPCLAPRGDWRRFVRRNLPVAGQAPEGENPEGDAGAQQAVIDEQQA